VRFGFSSLDGFYEAIEFVDMGVDVGALPFEQVDTRKAFLNGDMTLCRTAIANVV
jgi:hypothetical protein